MVTPGTSVTRDEWLVELQLWVISIGASGWLIDLKPYEVCRVAGVVERLRLDPKEGLIRALVTDGTGGLRVQWPIRRFCRQLAAAPGKGVVLEGLAVVGEDGELLLPDPVFKIVAFPEVA